MQYRHSSFLQRVSYEKELDKPELSSAKLRREVGRYLARFDLVDAVLKYSSIEVVLVILRVVLKFC